MRRSGAFTIIELLVVIGIIGVLLALVIPFFSRASYSANRLVCIANIRSQYDAQLAYAGDNGGYFLPQITDSPDYQRRNSISNANLVSAFRGRYLIDTRVMICPLVAQNEGGITSGVPYQRNDWLINISGGWNTSAPNVYTAYMWFAGYTAGGAKLTMLNNEPAFPMNMKTSSSKSRAFITHRLNYYSLGAVKYRHEVCHDGRGLGGAASSYTDWRCKDMPVCFLDGSVVSRDRSEILPRMMVGTGNYPGPNPGYPGIYIW